MSDSQTNDSQSHNELKLVEVESLIVPAFHSIHFPLKRNRSKLEASIKRDGLLEEHPIVLRRSKERRDKYEIIAGVGRYDIAIKQRIKNLPSIIKTMTDAEARIYAARDNLRQTMSPLTVVQAIILARDIEAQGGEKYSSEAVRRAANVNFSYYKCAVTGLNYAIDKLMVLRPEAANAGLAELVHGAIKHDDWTEFTKFYTSELEVSKFKRQYYKDSERAREQRRRQGLDSTTPPITLRHHPASPQITNVNREIEAADIFSSMIAFAAKVASHLEAAGETDFPPLLKAVCRDSKDYQAACKLFEIAVRHNHSPHPPAN